ncbi:MAG: DUF4398 domain-containing protein [Hylemonella sp.]
MNKLLLTPWLAGLALALTACASGPPAPTEQMAVSAAAIEQAVSAGAPELAPRELGTARDKLARAKVAMDADDNTLALRLAEQAQADAQLAVTKARTAKAEKAAAALAEDRRVLREEMQRNTNTK